MPAEADAPSAFRAYFDAATAAPLHPTARAALLAALEDGWADPTKLYAESRRASQLVDAARSAMADALGVRADEVAFCSSGTRAAELAIAGVRAARARTGDVVVYSAVEHSSVIRFAQAGASESVPVDGLGRVDPGAFAAAVAGPGVALAALQSANHEVGTLQPVALAAEICEEVGVPLYVDAASSAGRMPVPDGWSLLSASAVKWGGPAGVGVLVTRKGARWAKPWPVERVDPEPISVPLAVAAAAALRGVVAAAETNARLAKLIDHIRDRVARDVPDVEVIGDPVDRLPHLVTFSCLYVDGEALLHALDRRGFAVSSGSSCTAATLRPSHVLEAMGVLSHGNVRVSLHAGVTDDDVERFLTALPQVVADLRAEVGMIGR